MTISSDIRYLREQLNANEAQSKYWLDKLLDQQLFEFKKIRRLRSQTIRKELEEAENMNWNTKDILIKLLEQQLTEYRK